MAEGEAEWEEEEADAVVDFLAALEITTPGLADKERGAEAVVVLIKELISRSKERLARDSSWILILS